MTGMQPTKQQPRNIYRLIEKAARYCGDPIAFEQQQQKERSGAEWMGEGKRECLSAL